MEVWGFKKTFTVNLKIECYFNISFTVQTEFSENHLQTSEKKITIWYPSQQFWKMYQRFTGNSPLYNLHNY